MEKKIVFIFGCQRSGTTALLKSLGSLGEVKAFPEARSPLCSKDVQGLKLDPLGEVYSKIQDVQERIVIVKPLVQSHYAADILKYFRTSSCAIWMFRNYSDVISSMLVKWPTISKESHLLPIFSDNKGSNMGFREAYPGEVVAQAEALYDSEPTREEVCGMFWYARNSLFFHQKLSGSDNVYLVGYDDFIKNPNQSTALLGKVGLRVSGSFIESNFNAGSFGKGGWVKDNIRSSLKDRFDFMFEKLSLESNLRI